MQLLFRLPFMLLEAAVRGGLKGLAALTGLVRGDDDETQAPAPSAAPEPPRSFTGAGADGPPPPTAEEAIQRRRDREAAEAAAPPVTPPRAAPAPRPAARAAETPSRRRRNGTAPAASSPAPAPAPSAPTAPTATPAHVDREATIVESVGPAEDVHGQITVDEPWDGYDQMSAGAIVERLRDANEATRGVVRLYEQMHKKRATVVRATG